MLLTLDIGNTNITLGVFDKDNLRASWRMATDTSRTADQYGVEILTLLHHRDINRAEITEIAVCSVVPPLLGTFVELCTRYFHLPPFVVGPGVKTGMRIRMDNPREVGADRIVDAVAAHRLYGGPLIIVDLGTAITFDTVSKEGDYLGGAIAPGLNIAAEALFSHTAALPRIHLAAPKRAIGTNTVDAMQSGLIFGFVGLIESIVTRIKNELGENALVIATGGYASLLTGSTLVIDKVNADLTLIGLRLINEMNKA
jgi:type III pantothenate kinase